MKEKKKLSLAAQIFIALVLAIITGLLMQNYADFAQRINALDTTGIDIQYVSGGNTALLEHIRVLEIFNGSNFLKFSIEQTDKGLVLVTKSGVTENRKLLNVDENKVDISGDYIPV